MIDVLSDELIELGEAGKLLPGDPDRATLYRWALGPGSHGVQLETVKVGRKRFTSKQAIQVFVEQVTAAAGKPSPKVRTNRQRAKEIQAAERKLAKAGI